MALKMPYFIITTALYFSPSVLFHGGQLNWNLFLYIYLLATVYVGEFSYLSQILHHPIFHWFYVGFNIFLAEEDFILDRHSLNCTLVAKKNSILKL